MTSPTIIFETFLAPAWYKTYLYMTEYVERYTHVPAILLNGESLRDFSEAHADAGFISSLSYIQLLSQKPCPVELIAASVPQGANDHDTLPSLFDIVVRKESALTSVSDLAGCVWAYHAATSQAEDDFMSGQGSPAWGCGETIETTSQAQSLRLILDGKADAAAIDARMFDIVLTNSPRMAAQLRILGTYSYSTSPLVVVASHVKPSLREKIQEAFLNVHRDTFFAQRLQEGALGGFIAVKDRHYQNIDEGYWKGLAHSLLAEPEVEARLSATMP